MPAAAIGLVATAYAANQQKKAAKGASNAAQSAADAATAEQRRQYDLTRQDNMPWLLAGQDALAQMQALNGGNLGKFFESPEYQFTRQQGISAQDASAASRGNLFGGSHSRDLTNYASGLASQQYGNYYNRLAAMAGIGQNTASNLGSVGQNYANAVGNNMFNAANTRASSYQQQADANSQLAGNVGSSFGRWYANNSANNGGGTGWYLGNNPGRG